MCFKSIIYNLFVLRRNDYSMHINTIDWNEPRRLDITWDLLFSFCFSGISFVLFCLFFYFNISGMHTE